jgi:hypothetical protein
MIEYHRRVAETAKIGDDIATATKQRGKEVEQALTEISEAVAKRLVKLLQPLSMNIQMYEEMASPVRKKINSMTCVVWESAFSTELKHAEIAVSGAIAVREINTTNNLVCVMGATALDVSIPGRIYRCKIKVANGTGIYIALGVASQNIIRANKFKYTDWFKLGHGDYLNFSHGFTYSHSDEAVNNK